MEVCIRTGVVEVTLILDRINTEIEAPVEAACPRWTMTRSRLGSAVGTLVSFQSPGDEWMRIGGRHATTAVRPRQNLEQVSIGIFEVDSSPVVPIIDLIGLRPGWVRPVAHSTLLDAAEDLIELRLAHEEGILLRRDLPLSLHEVESELVADTDECKGIDNNGRLEP